jgi:hypothetical protein
MEGLCGDNNRGASGGSTPCCHIVYGDPGLRCGVWSAIIPVATSEIAGVKVNSFMPFTSSQFYWAMMIAGIGESMIGETRTEPKIDHYASSG